MHVQVNMATILHILNRWLKKYVQEGEEKVKKKEEEDGEEEGRKGGVEQGSVKGEEMKKKEEKKQKCTNAYFHIETGQNGSKNECPPLGHSKLWTAAMATVRHEH